MKEATEEDWATEYGDLILSIKVVRDLEEAIDHINRYNTGHSETIVTENLANAHKFQRAVDAAAVYVNASTRFTDGFEFGFGAEIGISTQKLHARGPMGLQALTGMSPATGLSGISTTVNLPGNIWRLWRPKKAPLRTRCVLWSLISRCRRWMDIVC